jgi:TolB-like protein
VAEAARGGRLESWKQIAAFFERGQRTVQRWEREEGLPVRRHLHGKSGNVYALTDELTAWRRARDQGPDTETTARGVQRRGRWKSRRVAVLATPVVALTLLAPLGTWIQRDPLRLVVTPFRNLTGDPSIDLISHGLTEETITQMARLDLRRVAVVSNPSPAATTDPDSAVPAGGYRLEGSVRRVGARLRVTARLLTNGHRRLLWTETFDGAMADGAVQAELGRSITTAVSTALAR